MKQYKNGMWMVLGCVAMLATGAYFRCNADPLDPAISVPRSVTGVRLIGDTAEVNLTTGEWTFNVALTGAFGDKLPSDFGFSGADRITVTVADLVAQGIPSGSQVTLRTALRAAVVANLRAAISE